MKMKHIPIKFKTPLELKYYILIKAITKIYKLMLSLEGKTRKQIIEIIKK